MLCDKCKKNPASVHMQHIVNGVKSEKNLCQECASAGEANIGLDNLFQGILGSFLASGIAHEIGEVSHAGLSLEGPQCSGCGTTYSELRDKGRFGCVQCYEAFSKQLEQIFGSIQNSTEHRGKIPQRSGARLNLQRKLEDLRRQQQSFVLAEEYERAAAIRDEIRRLEKE